MRSNSALTTSQRPQVTKVDEPSKFGVVLTMPGSSTIDRFVEKPKEFVGNRINAGIYIFNPSILDRIDVSSSFSPPLVLTDASHT